MLDVTKRIARNACNFSRMMEHVSGGMEIETLSSHELGHAARRCQSCSETEVCETWLDQARPSDKRAPGFCPNTMGTWSRVETK